MTGAPAWADDVFYETRCAACQRPRFLTLSAILQGQPVRCPCGFRSVPVAPPGLPEIATLLADLEAAVRCGAARTTPTRAPKGP